MPDTEVFTIHNLADTGFELPYQPAPFRPNYFSFVFSKDGIGGYSIDEKAFKVLPGTIYFTNPSNYRTFSWISIKEVFLITFDEGFLKKYLGLQVFEDFPFLLTEIISPKLASPAFFKKAEDIYLLIYQHYHGESANKYKIIGHLLSVLLFYIKEYFWQKYNPIHEGKRKSQIIRSFQMHLEEHFRKLVAGEVGLLYHVQDYAALQNLHPGYLSAVIKAKTGKSIQSWIGEKITLAAEAMLMNTGLPVKEIAYKLGFLETAHFSNHFKKHTGCSPTSFRKGQVKN